MAPFGLEQHAKNGRTDGSREGNRPAKRTPATRFVKFDYLLIVNDTVVQAVLVASSRFSIKTGGCGR